MEVNKPRSREGALRESSLVGTVGLIAGVLGGTAAVFGLILYFLDPDAASLAAIDLVLAVTGLVFYALTNREAIARAASGRSTSLLVLEGVLFTAALGGLAAANYFAAKSTQEWDLTRDKLFTLHEQSVKVAKGLTKPIAIIAFMKPIDQNRGRLESIVDLYRAHTDKLSLEFVNPDTAPPALVKKYKMTPESPRIVVARGDERHTKVKNVSEQDLTNALVSVAERPPRKVYFLTGHGEPSIEDKDTDNGLRHAAQGLIDEGYEVAQLSLVDKDAIPGDATVVIAAGMKSAVFPNELAALRAYADKGGRLALLLDPGVDAGLGPLLDAYGAEVGDDLVVDPNPASKALGFGPDAPVVTRFEPHPITDPLRGSALLFYWVRSVSPKVGAAASGVTVTTLLLTSEASWGEKRFKEGGDVERGEEDTPGPVPIALAASKSTAAVPGKVTDEARVVVAGDASFAVNRFHGMGGNGDLMKNVVSWLAGDESRISIRPKSRSACRMPLTEAQQYGIVFLSANLFPLVVVGLGFSVWAVRRRK